MTVYPDRLHAYLIAKREFYGADTEIGHRCSNVVELLGSRPGCDRRSTDQHRRQPDADTGRDRDALRRRTRHPSSVGTRT